MNVSNSMTCSEQIYGENLCDHHEVLDWNFGCLEAQSIVNHCSQVSNFVPTTSQGKNVYSSDSSIN